jgi:hypothetical protein
MCCLKYENDVYVECNKGLEKMPKIQLNLDDYTDDEDIDLSKLED